MYDARMTETLTVQRTAHTYPVDTVEDAIRRAVAKHNPEYFRKGNRIVDDLYQVARIAVWREAQRRGVAFEDLYPGLAHVVARRACIDLTRADQGRWWANNKHHGVRELPWSLEHSAQVAGISPVDDHSLRERSTVCARGVNAVRQIDHEGVRAAFEAAVAALPDPRHRHIARRRVLDEADYSDIADEVGFTPNTTQVYWSGIKSKLAAALADYDPEARGQTAAA